MIRIGIILLALLELGGTVFITVLTWLFSVWFLDDSQASRMTASDWYWAGAYRALGSIVVAAIAGGMVFGINRLVMNALRRRASLTDRDSFDVAKWSAFVAFAVIAFAGVCGALQFAIRKPFM